MKRVNISQVDAVFSNGSYPIEFLFYYEPGFETTRLRRALEKLSSIFWPAFGEYRDGAIVFDGYREAECFEEEVIDREFDSAEVERAGPGVVSRFALPELKRLFFLKAIRFKNGLVLVPKLNHLAGDGYSYFLFLSFLAALSRPTMVPFKSTMMSLALKPHHRRTVLRDFVFQGEGLKPLTPGGPFSMVYDEIPRQDVQSVIQEAASSGRRISSNDVLSALALRKLVRARPDFWAGEVRLTIPIDVRGKVKEYGRGFFGNGIMFHTLTFKKEPLDISPLQEIAIEVRNSMPLISRETYVDFLRKLEEMLSAGRRDEFRPYNPERGCLVTNLSRLPTDRLDFGAGPPRLVLPLTRERNGAGILSKGENYIIRLAY
jgi:hypothetical protein